MNKTQRVFIVLAIFHLLPNVFLLIYNQLVSTHGVMGLVTLNITLSLIFFVFAFNGQKWANWSIILLTLILLIPSNLLLYFYPQLPLHNIIGASSIVIYVVFLIIFAFVFPKLARINK
jgi:hypothetical protein